jgi:hypothetical protein
MRGRMLVLVMLLAAAGRAEIIDRIAVTVGKRVIAASDVALEIRLSAFMNQAKPDFSPESKRKTADRLVERALIQEEVELSRYPSPEASEAAPALAALKQEQFSGDAAYREALSSYGITEEELKRYLLEQTAVSGFIDIRFGPSVQFLEDDLRAYYSERFVPQWKNRTQGPAPAFDEVRDQVADALRAERVNRLLDEWLKEAKGRARVVYKPEAFQ